MTVRELMAALRHGPYAWPGGYPCYFYADDGQVMSHQTVRSNIWQIARSTRDRINDGWRVIAHDVYWEGPTEIDPDGIECPSAYGDPDEEQDVSNG